MKKMDLPKLSSSYYKPIPPNESHEDPFTISLIEYQLEQENDPEWRKNNLEADLRSTDWILKKVRESDTYATQLYNALCNNSFVQNEIFTIIKGDKWNCSWRYAGGIIAHMKQVGDYLDWYCKNGDEGTVTDEIAEDLLKLGWKVKND
jgi:hypothetical protein